MIDAALHNTAPSLEEARAYIEQLDLTYLVDSMCAENYPLPRWTRDDALKCAALYKNFLLLFKAYPKERLVPTREIDEFWHNHILYTKQYHSDCQRVFGHYLHHQPALPTDDHSVLVNDFLTTQQLYFAMFKKHMTIITTTY